MTVASISAVPAAEPLPLSYESAQPAVRSARITSIDALRGFTMFAMIFVNDLAGAHNVPDWMVHYSDRHRGGSGMTFVDLVFPAFLFIVGMSVCISLWSRLQKGEPIWKIAGHVLWRTFALLLIGVMMVNAEGGPSTEKMGWSATTWRLLMFICAMLAFCSFTPLWISNSPPDSRQRMIYKRATWIARGVGFAGLVVLALLYRNRRDGRMLTLRPFSIHTSWYGILGLIGWAYFMSSAVFLIFRTRRLPLLTCTALMFALFAADKAGAFKDFWLSHYVGIGEMLGSHAAISAAGVLLATILLTPDTQDPWERIKFTLWFIVAAAAGALVLHRIWGISKNNATPSWCLWACAVTAGLWPLFYLIGDVLRAGWLTRPLAIAGQNVLLAYLISEMLESLFRVLHLGNWYDHLADGPLSHAVARSGGCAAAILLVTALLNRVGFRLKL